MIRKKDLKNPIVCIVAMNQNRVIGDGNDLLWHLPGDLKRLKTITMGTPLIMGRKTWDSIGRPLPGRASIVLTKSLSWKAEGAIVTNSFDNAIIEANIWIEANKKEKRSRKVKQQKKSNWIWRQVREDKNLQFSTRKNY